MKILFVNCSYVPNYTSGAEKVVKALAEAMAARGHQATVVTTQPEGRAQTRELNGVRVRYVPVINVYRPFRKGRRPSGIRRAVWHALDSSNPLMARTVADLIDEEKPDVVNTHNLAGFSAAVMSSVNERSIPLVHTLHDQYLLCPRSTMFRDGHNCVRACFGCGIMARPRKRNTSHVDVVVGVSRFILQRHLQFGYFACADARVVYNAIERFPGEEAESRDRRAYRFGYLGQIHETKGVHALIDAFLAEPELGAELWIGGTGDTLYEAGLKSRTAGAPNIRWLGFVSAEEFLRSIDVLVVPSIWQDTAPLVVLESLSAGTPVIGSIRGGIPEFVTSDTGWLFDPDDPDALRRTLRLCVGSRKRLPEMAGKARAFARGFGLSRFADGYLEAYETARSRRAEPNHRSLAV